MRAYRVNEAGDVSGRGFQSFEQFASAVLEAGISHIVLRQTHETRPRSLPGERTVVVGPVHEAKLIAYRAGHLLHCTVPGDEIPSCVEWLEAHEIRIKRVSDNIG